MFLVFDTRPFVLAQELVSYWFLKQNHARKEGITTEGEITSHFQTEVVFKLCFSESKDLFLIWY